MSFDVRDEEPGCALPPVDRDTPGATDVVNEVAVTGPQFQDAGTRRDQTLEIRVAKRLP
jgi:hypothetical protein